MNRTKRSALALLAAFALLFCASPAYAKSNSDEIKVRRVELVLETATVRVNQTRTLYAEITPSNADNQTLAWSSSNWEIVAVDEEGTITGISPGTAEVTATSHNGKTGRCIVTVPASSISSSYYLPDIETADRTESGFTGGERMGAAALRLQVEKAVKAAGQGKTAKVTCQNKTVVSTAALRGAAYAAEAAGGTARVVFQTLDEAGGLVGQLTFSPAKAPAEDYDIQLGITLSGSSVQQAASAAAAHFGEKAVAVRLEQQGSYGMTVQVDAAADLSGMSTASLKLYRYSDGSYTQIENSTPTVTSDGRLRFQVSRGGTYLIVS